MQKRREEKNDRGAQSSAPFSPPKSAMQRTLYVAELIAKYGPIGLSDLCRISPLPKTSLWRGAEALIEVGWVRRRSLDKAYEISHKLDFLMADAHMSHIDIDKTDEKIEALKSSGFKFIRLASFIQPGKFVIMESNQKQMPINQPLSLIDDDDALNAQALLSRNALVRHLNAFMLRASPKDADFIKSGAFLHRLEHFGQNPSSNKTCLMIDSEDSPIFIIGERA